MESTRIVLINMPPLLRDIVRETLARVPDLHVVAEHEADVDLSAAVEEAQADFVIVGSHPSISSVAAAVGAGRVLRALELQADGRDGVLYELRPYRVSLGEISPAALLQIIRAAPAWNAEP